MTWVPACYGIIRGDSLAACTYTKKPSLHRRVCNPRSKLNLHCAPIQLYLLADWVRYSSGRRGNITTQPQKYSSVPVQAQEQLPRCERCGAYTLTAQVYITLRCCSLSHKIQISAVIAFCWFFSLPVLIMGVTRWPSSVGRCLSRTRHLMDTASGSVPFVPRIFSFR